MLSKILLLGVVYISRALQFVQVIFLTKFYLCR